MQTKKILHMIAFTLVILGGINWGLYGLFRFDLVEVLFGAVSELPDVLYVLVGIAAVYLVITHGHDCRVCGESKK